jgi:hypothetical protein
MLASLSSGISSQVKFKNWDVFKGKIVKFTAGKKDGEYEIQFGKERYWYSDDDMFPTQSAASIALDAKLEAEGN